MHKNKALKNRLSGLLAGFLAVASISAILPVPMAFAQLSKISVTVDDRMITMDPLPLIQNNRTLVPIRMISEEMGAQVDWDESQRTVRVTKSDGTSIFLWVDNRLVTYENNGQKTFDVCDVAPKIIDNRTYVPLRLVGNALGVSVDWDDAQRRVLINTQTAAAKTSFYNISFNNLAAGQQITNKTDLSLNFNGALPAGASQVKYLLLDTQTAVGKMVARSTNVQQSALWTPDPAQQGQRILAAAVCDSQGNFLAGTAIPINLVVTPQVSMLGLVDQQVLTGSIDLTSSINFAAESVIYDFKNLSTGASTQSGAVDPMTAYTFNPTPSYNGGMEIRAIAVDKAGNQYVSAPLTVQIAVPVAPNTLTFKKFSTTNLGKIPVTLSLSRNFDVSLTQYWARNTATKQEVLLNEKPYGDYSWFPGPNMAGTWEIYTKVTTPAGKVYTSNSYVATVPATASLILNSVGPDEVITGEVKLKAISNVEIQEVSYIVMNPGNGSQKNLGTTTDLNQVITWTPEAVNEGNRLLKAVAVLKNGQTIQSEAIPVKIYLGKTFSSQPIVAKDQFINYVTPMALATQKENGMSAALQVAQAILETGWGQSVPVDKYSGLFSNNLFGIKGSAIAGSVISNTWEEYYGTTYRIDAKFRAYNNVLESWNDHNALLLTRERYIPYTNVMFDSTLAAYALRRCGYATDSKYPNKLIKIIKDNNLDRLDLQKL